MIQEYSIMVTGAGLEKLIDQCKPMILDGGLGSELVRRGFDISSPLWSAALISENPQALLDVHRAYLDAGAQCVTSASYQASLPGWISAGVSLERIEELLRQSVEIAQTACRQFVAQNPDCAYQPLVAASIGPYGAYLADGSEYRGDYGVNDQALVEFHRQRLAWLDHSGADLLACETIPSLQEASVLCELLKTVNTPAWVSFSCRNQRLLNDGSPISEAVALFAQHPGVLAVGVNCTAPQYIEGLIGEIKSVSKSKAVVVYPNSGEHYDAVTKTWQGTERPLESADAARVWFNAGADIVGGCCRMGPAHIEAIAIELCSESRTRRG